MSVERQQGGAYQLDLFDEAQLKALRANTDDGLVGQQLFAGEATRLAYGSDEAREGRDAFLEKRAQDYSEYPWHY